GGASVAGCLGRFRRSPHPRAHSAGGSPAPAATRPVPTPSLHAARPISRFPPRAPLPPSGFVVHALTGSEAVSAGSDVCLSLVSLPPGEPRLRRQFVATRPPG